MFLEKNKYHSDGSISIHEKNGNLINIAAWDKGCKLSSYSNGEPVTHEISPSYSIFRLSPLLDPNYLNSPVYEFKQSIPSDIVDQISKFQVYQLHILNLVASNIFAQQLLKDNPVLLWLIVDCVVKNTVSTSKVNKLFENKSITILRTIFPCADKTQLKFIKSLELYKYDSSVLDAVKKAINSKEVLSQLRHAKNITYSLLKFISKMNVESFFENKLTLLVIKYHQNKGNKCLSEIYKIYVDTINLNLRINHVDAHPLINDKVLTVNKLIEALDTLLQQSNPINYSNDIKQNIILRQLSNSRLPYNNFPKAFITGNKLVIHISTYCTLEEEAIYMNTCVTSYADKIMRGKSCLYKVLYPERGTIELRVNNDDVYLNQFYLRNNKTPSKRSFLYIKKWIDSHNL